MKRGAATLLTKWGLSKAERAATPVMRRDFWKGERRLYPVYVESPVSTKSFFQRLGFVCEDGFSGPLSELNINRKPDFRQALCMVKKLAVFQEEGVQDWTLSLDMNTLKLDYDSGIAPQSVVQAVFDRIEAYGKVQSFIWTHLEPVGKVMASANLISKRWPDKSSRPPLWGVPFSVKDNFRVDGIATTIGCPALEFIADCSAKVYELCIESGALFIGKTNMDQLAIGLTGCRSPYGTLHSISSIFHIAGGSSSGSAVSVSAGLVSFSLGTDTAGSIRVPAMFNGIPGFKPTKGTVSAHGVVPACLHQDCVGFLGTNMQDIETVWNVCKGFHGKDYLAKPPPFQLSSQVPSTESGFTFSFGIPPTSALTVCTFGYSRHFYSVVAALVAAGGQLVELDWTPFASAHELLYDSTFVLERFANLPEGWFEKNKEKLHPDIRSVFEDALERHNTAIDVFKDLRKQAKYKRAVEDMLKLCDESRGLTIMVVPTTPSHPTIDEVVKDPLGINGKLGAFTHFANILDLAAVSIPCGGYRNIDLNMNRLPFGVTMLAGTGLDQQLLQLAKRLEGRLRDMEHYM